MLKSASTGTPVIALSLMVTRGIEAIQTDMATSAVTANASVGEGSQLQKPRRAGSAAMRARSEASNARDGEITGRSSSALQRWRNSSARLRQLEQAVRCSSTARRSAGLARPSKYSTSLSSIPAQRSAFRSVLLIWPSLPSVPAASNSYRIHQGCKLRAQRFVRAEQQRLQRALRTFQDPRDFIVIKLLVLMYQHSRALLFRPGV